VGLALRVCVCFGAVAPMVCFTTAATIGGGLASGYGVVESALCCVKSRPQIVLLCLDGGLLSTPFCFGCFNACSVQCACSSTTHLLGSLGELS
jgi:hypothetical protein